MPEAPTSFTATGVSDSEIDLAWTDSIGATGYEVDKQNSDLSWSAIAPSLADNATGYQDMGLDAGTTYAYRVEAIDAGGSSAPTGTQSGLTTPAVPTHVVATPNGTGEVDLTWDAMTSATTYDISVNINGGGYNSVTTGIGTNSYAYGASAGTSYVFQIVAQNATGASDPGTSNAALTIPAVPGSFTATPINAGEVDLSWSDVAGGELHRSSAALGGGQYGPLISGLASNVVSYHDTTVAAGTTYTYRIHATNATGDSATVTHSALTVPAAPTITSATVLSDDTIALVWTFDSGTVNGYRVYREDDNSGIFVQVGLDMTSDTSAYEDVGLTSATPYDYRVVAFNASGESAVSDTGTLTTVPETPTSFTAAGVSTSQVNLAWTDSTGATGYEVDKQNSDLSWSAVGPTLADDATGYQDSGLAAGTSYTYRVLALDAGGASAPSDSQSGLTIPAAPTHVVATPNGTGEVDLTWDAMTGAATYDTNVNLDGGGYNSVTTGVTSTSYPYISASAGTSYVFQIVADDATGSSDPGTSNAALTIPDVPGSFSAAPVSAGQVNLSWTDVAGASSYTIERALGNTAYGPLVSGLASNAVSYPDTTVAAGMTYHYRIHASDATGDSATTTQTALTVPATVSITSTSIISDSEIDLRWQADTGTVDGYRVYRQDNNTGDFIEVGSDLSVATLSLDDTGLTPGTPYVYRVVAFNASGESAPTTTPPR